MTSDTPSHDSEIFRIAAEWHAKWRDIQSGHHSPAELGHMFADLNDAARRLAHEAHSRRMDLAEIAEVTRIEMEILKDELHSPMLHQAV